MLSYLLLGLIRAHRLQLDIDECLTIGDNNDELIKCRAVEDANFKECVVICEPDQVVFCFMQSSISPKYRALSVHGKKLK